MSAPLLQQTSPADNLSNAAVTANLVLIFDQQVRLGTSGTFRIYKSDGTLVHTISVTDSSQVSLEISSRPEKVIINPNVNLDPGTGYYVLIDAGAVENRTGEDFAGISSPTAFNFTTAGSPPGGGDTTAPTLSNTTPADNATGVAVGSNLVLTFNESVQAGSGNIEIRNANGTIAKTIAITDGAQASFSGNQLTINPTTDLSAGSGYYVTMASGVVRDLANNNFAGISSTTDFNFTTANLPADTTAPTLQSTTPVDNATGVAIGTNLVLTFSEAVQAGAGSILIRNGLGGLVAQSIPITDATQVTFSGNQVTVNPATDLILSTEYYIQIEPGVIRDLSNNDFAGILSSSTAFNFTTAAPPTGDSNAPSLTNRSPLDNATGVLVDSNIVLTFNEAVRAGAGTIQIRKVSDNSLDQAISVTDTSQVHFSGNQVTINPTTDFATSTAYYVVIAPGVIRDLAGNNYSGFGTPTAFNFTTSAVDTSAPVLTGTFPWGNDVYVSSNLGLSFSEPVKAGAGNIQIRKTSDNTLVQSISITDATQVSFSGNDMTINPSVDLSGDTSYYVTLASGVVLDLANNPFAGISSPTTFNFMTGDGTPPVLTGSSFDGNAPVYADDPHALILYFDESVSSWSGNIEIHDASDGSLVRVISTNDGSQQVQTGGWVRIDPNPDLAEGKNYYITVGPGVFTDNRGNPFGGVSSPDTLAFTTIRTGTIGNDTLTGDGADNAFDGGIGHDTLIGGDGDDTYILTNLEGGETSVVFQIKNSTSGSWFHSGRTLSLPFEDNEIQAAAFDTSGDGIVDWVHLWYYGPIDGWDLNFGTSSIGTNLVPGTYLDATAELSAGHPFLQVSGNSGASLPFGSFTVTNAVFDYSGPSPTIVSLSINFELHSDFGTEIHGVANYNYSPAGPATLDTIVENANEGIDTVKVAISYVLPANFENLILAGHHDLSGTGNAANNVITGNEGENLIDGKVGADTMIGGDGDDTYIVDNVGDHVIEVDEFWWNGFDVVQSSVTHTLDNGVEKLVLTGSANLNGTGNDGDNILIGNTGANTLSGASGNDTYYIDSLADTVVENFGGGVDTVITSLTYTLGNNVDNLTLTGTANLNGTGNALDNHLIGTMKLPGTGGAECPHGWQRERYVGRSKRCRYADRWSWERHLYHRQL